MPVNNVGILLSESARSRPGQIAVAAASRRSRPRPGSVDSNQAYIDGYETITFEELDRSTDRIAAGLIAAGAQPGMRLALLVKPGIDFVKLVFALFKSGVVTILIDPGMGRKNMIRCLAESNPDGFVAIPLAQAIRTVLRFRFPSAKFNVTVGRRWFWGGRTLRQIERLGRDWIADRGNFEILNQADDPAAIIFTTGSTGPPKGVLYHHRTFVKQVSEIQNYYGIRPGTVDVSGFPLFALFNAGMGATTVMPDMDYTRPADVDPEKIIAAVRDWKADQSFGSPALWTTVGRYCEQKDIRLPTLNRVLTAGAPVPPHVLERLRKIIAEKGEIHTPYGATEALPVASIDSRTVLEETAEKTHAGKGTCVGNCFPGIETRIIRISDQPIASLDECEFLAANEIGELIVKGDVVTREYVTRVDANAIHKISDGDAFWHRMGDLGYLDQENRFWFCGRKGHRVQTAAGEMYTIPCEAIFNCHPVVYRSALIGIGPATAKTPVVVIETWPDKTPSSVDDESRLKVELRELAEANPLTANIENFLFIRKMPVDIRHNSKIFREKLTIWAESQLRDRI